jgi:heptosyltransferase-2
MEYLAYRVYKLAVSLLALLPLPLVFRLGSLLGLIAYPFAGSYRKLALSNLRIAFGREKSEKEIRAIARKHFRLLGGNILSAFRVSRMSVPEVDALMEITNPEVMERVTSRKEGAIFVCGHRGCIELFAQTPTLYRPKIPAFFYQRISNPFMEEEVRRKRTQVGHIAFDRATDMQATMHHLRAGNMVGIQTDQHAGDFGEWLPFFDKLCSTSPLTGIMAKGGKAAVIFARLDTIGAGKWRLTYEELAAPGELKPEEVNFKFPAALERAIRENPPEWFWVHNRWKLPNPNFLLQGYKRGMRLPPGMTVADLQPFRMVIRSPNWLGDAIMALPAVRAFKEGRPDAHVSVLTPAKLAGLWETAPYVDKVIPIPEESSVFQVAKRLKEEPVFDAAILLPNSLRTALEVWLAGIPRRYGFPGHHRERFLDQIPLPPKKITGPPPHHADRYLELARQAGAVVSASAVDQTDLLRAPRAPAPEPRAVCHLPEGGIPANPPARVGIVPGAEYGPAKRWFPESFAAAANLVGEQIPGALWTIFGVEKDAEAAGKVLAGLKVPCVNLVGRTNLAQLMAELKKCDVVLTNDTGTMHLAAALGVPLVAIFGSTEPALTGPLGRQHRLLRQHVPCSPCFLRECPFNMECMRGITPEMAASAVLELLATSPKS